MIRTLEVPKWHIVAVVVIRAVVVTVLVTGLLGVEVALGVDAEGSELVLGCKHEAK
jgi:uncharacterized membrane protein